jgi:hypothetical protein
MANRTIWIMGARLAFGEGVFEKKAIAGDPTSKARYGCSLLLDASNKQVAEIEALEAELCLEHDWKDKTPGAAMHKTLAKKDRLALHDGDDKAKYAGFPGHKYLAPSSDTRPTAVDRDRSPLTKDDGKIYSGCYVNAKVEIWVQDNNWGQRVNATLLGVQFVKDGDAFGAGSPPANPDDFPDLDASDGDDDMFA